MVIKTIKFPSRWYTPDTDVSISGPRVGIACFELGLGPCGKTVERLILEPMSGGEGISIVQVHDDRTKKVFYYQWRDILGRIEIED